MANVGGYIKLHRQIEQWEWYQDANTMRVWIHILLNTNFEDRRYKGIEIKAGQCVFGYQACADKLGLSKMQVRTAMDRLKECGMLTSYLTRHFQVLTVENWEKYQGKDVQGNTLPNTSVTPHQHQHKKEKNEKNNIASGRYVPEPPKYQRLDEVEDYRDAPAEPMPEYLREKLKKKK